jgi:hypothetical protein
MRRLELIGACLFLIAGGLFGATAAASAAASTTAAVSEEATSTQALMAKDSDADGLNDFLELKIFKTNPQKADTDRDGNKDRMEVENGYNPTGRGKLVDGDYDHDGLSDRLELIFGTDLTVSDTDGDGFTDGQEVKDGYSPTSTDRVLLEKRIVIILSKQKMQQTLGGVIMATYPVSTGRPGMATPKGEFKILKKYDRAWSRMAGLWMPWWMQFTPAGNGIHELPEWPGGKKEGAYHLGHPVSHGCVRLGVGPAKTMYDWAPVGTRITIVR